MSDRSKNGAILAQSWLDDIVITASSEASADLAVANVQNDQPSEPWRSDGSGTHTWTGDFGEAKPCNTIGLLPTNLGLDDTVTLELADDAAITTNVVTHSWPGRYSMLGWGEFPWDLGSIDGAEELLVYDAPFVVEQFELATRRYFRITFERASGYTQIGCARLGYAWQPQRNLSWGLELPWRNPSELFQAEGGQGRVLVREQYRSGTVRWQFLNATDAKLLDDLLYHFGRQKLVLFIPYPTETDQTLQRRHIVLARITGSRGPRRVRHKIYEMEMTIEEAL